MWVPVRTASEAVLTSTHNLHFEQKYEKKKKKKKKKKKTIGKLSVFGGEIFNILVYEQAFS